jgi:hypothetical protein
MIRWKGGKTPTGTRLGDIDIVLTNLSIGMDDEETHVTNRLQRDLPGRFITDTGRDAMLTQAMRDIQKTTVEAAAVAQARDADKETAFETAQTRRRDPVPRGISSGDHCQE